MRRPTIYKNVQKQLWAESMGHCMNPICHKKLISGSTNIGEMAHIETHKSGGSSDFDNLILLCKNCHKTEDDSRDREDTEQKLREWKQNRQKKIRKCYEMEFDSIDKLKEVVSPILRENQQYLVLMALTQTIHKHILYGSKTRKL